MSLLKKEVLILRDLFNEDSIKGYEEYNLGKYENALTLHNSALKKANKIKDDNLICKANTNIGNCYFRLGKLEKSIFNHTIAKDISIKFLNSLNIDMNLLEDEKCAIFELPGILNHIGIVYLQKKSFFDADYEFKEGLKVITLLKNSRLHYQIKEKLDYVKIRLKKSRIKILKTQFQWDNVESEYVKLIELVSNNLTNVNPKGIYKQLNTRMKANLKIELGSLYIRQNRLEEAENIINQAEDLGKAWKDTEIKRFAKFKLAQITYLKGNQNEALAIINNKIFKSIEMGGLLENKNAIVEYYLFKANILANLNQYDSCINVLLEVQSVLTSIDFDLGVVKLFTLLIKYSLEMKLLQITREIIEFLINSFFLEFKISESPSSKKSPQMDLKEIFQETLSLVTNKTKNDVKIEEIYDEFSRVHEYLNSVSFKFIEKGKISSLQSFIPLTLLFFSTIRKRPKLFGSFKNEWINFYKKKFNNLSMMSLLDLASIKYNETYLESFDDCIRKIFNIIELELFRKVLNPIKKLYRHKTNLRGIDKQLSNRSYDNTDYQFLEFLDYLKNEDKDLRIVVIERFLLFLDDNQSSNIWFSSWSDFIKEFKLQLSNSQLNYLKSIGLLLDKKWSTTLGNKNLRQIRNVIEHKSSKTHTKQELVTLYSEFRPMIIGDDELLLEDETLLRIINNIKLPHFSSEANQLIM